MRKSDLFSMLMCLSVPQLNTRRRAGYSYLKPVSKEKFKQSRRKQLKLRSKNKAKRNRQA